MSPLQELSADDVIQEISENNTCAEDGAVSSVTNLGTLHQSHVALYHFLKPGEDDFHKKTWRAKICVSLQLGGSHRKH